MTAGALRLWVLLALRMRYVTLLALPLDRGTAPGREHGVDTTETGSKKLDGLLHLKDLPRGPALAPNKKAPQFMLDLFNAVTVSEGRPKSQKEILEGNTVRSFEDKGNSGERFHFFNLSSVGREERMIKAEFRWFRKKQKFYLGKSFGPHFYKVDLYEVLDSRVKPWRGNLITSRLVPLHTQGWEVFNFTQTVSKWIRNSQENNGILVVTTLPSGSWMESARSPSSKRSGELMDTNAYLVLFSDDDRRTGASNQSFLGQPHPAAPELQDPHSRRRRASPGQPHPAAPELQDPHSRRRRASPGFPPHSRSQSCQRVPLFVDFEEIGWSGWIISPRGYNAYHCKGSCPFPLGGSLKATNHATVRSIMHALKLSSAEVEAPCCVPDKLQSISLLYFDDEENVVLKQYDDMVALSCGCH
ncbi:bone morphogenetic protein 2-like [Gymnodraco acuticeps]|uniref:Bone morphogenetic protein 2-like n=1 Tax=Gymnodraco acuticeps TaxID=8218 RepID=A0A6P8SLM1_GYMAC|nr:bone morphogenetic protein 2-like [Gymnodraco acuticeps]